MNGPVKLSHEMNIDLPGDVVVALVEARLAAAFAFEVADHLHHSRLVGSALMIADMACDEAVVTEAELMVKISEWLRSPS
jgi:hypothetical protein